MLAGAPMRFGNPPHTLHHVASTRKEPTMTVKTLIAAAASLTLSFGALAANEPAAGASKAPTAQQSKMATCNKDAGDKKGDERKKFMSECLSAKKPMTQQDKMKSCNKEAGDKSLKGDERKKFMSDCLKA